MMDTTNILEILDSTDNKRLTRYWGNNTEKYRLEIVGKNGQWQTVCLSDSEYTARAQWQNLITGGEIKRQ
jgi:hypothetical protein